MIGRRGRTTFIDLKGKMPKKAGNGLHAQVTSGFEYFYATIFNNRLKVFINIVTSTYLSNNHGNKKTLII